MFSWSGGGEFSKALLLNGSIIDLGHVVRVMLREAEYLQLESIGNGLSDVDDGEGFPHLKHLEFCRDPEIQQIIKCGPCTAAFPKLEYLSLSGLEGLKTI